MNIGSQIVFRQLFQRHANIRIPIIQRDYAQGRPAETEVREEFLNALLVALTKSADDPTLPLNLDFIYGAVEGDGKSRFLPLDGQQRLTTLFLLHWYLAWRDQQWAEFEQLFQASQHSRFAYAVRPSSTEFFDAFVIYRPSCCPDDVRDLKQLICDQPWYFRSWRLDPTIQSVLCMLDAIHHRFNSYSGLFARLIDEAKPTITFQLLNLEDFGLSDDLYIKMNARGKPLTEFENFKARYEQELAKQLNNVIFSIGEQSLSVVQYVATRMDTAWTDLVWRLRDKKSNLYDAAFMNIFRVVALVTRDPDSENYLSDVSLLRSGQNSPSYSTFQARGWLNERFTTAIIHLLDAWSRESGVFSTLLPDQRYFNERAVFDRIVVSGANLSYVEIVQFAAYVGFIARHQTGFDAMVFQEWMRIVRNLSINMDYNEVADLRRSVAGLNILLAYSDDILSHFAKSDNPTSGFSPQQIAEEKLKAELILGEQTWRETIDLAEEHRYFLGQIDFLLDFSGTYAARTEAAAACWTAERHTELQENFMKYLCLAEQMFTSQGLNELAGYRWQRALLSVGNYLLPSRRNHSFLVNSKDEQASWKRLLRGTGENVPGARAILRKLWDRLKSAQPLMPQLDMIITEADRIEPWRANLVRTPEAIDYCQNRSVRWNSATEIYLLRKTQMNGEHAELFTFCLYHGSLADLASEGRLQPLILSPYNGVVGTAEEPGIKLDLIYSRHAALFTIEFSDGHYHLYVAPYYLEDWPELLSLLVLHGFSFEAGAATRFCSYDDIQNVLLQLAQALAATFPRSSSTDNRFPLDLISPFINVDPSDDSVGTDTAE